MTTRRFSVGDEVYLSPDSHWLEDNPGDWNPLDVRGVIRELYPRDEYGVSWDNGMSNSYDDDDLIPFQKKVRIYEGDPEFSRLHA